MASTRHCASVQHLDSSKPVKMKSYTAGAKFDCLLFDMDDTLYPLSSGINLACRKNIQEYMLNKLQIEENLVPKMCLDLYKEYGTTMAGLKVLGYDFDYDDFHACVHGTLPYEKLKPDPVLRQLLLSIPQRKIIFTNSDKAHAATVLKKLGLEDCFEGIICFETLNPSSPEEHIPDQENSDNTDGGSSPGSDSSASSHKRILCKPSLESMEAVIEIAKLDAKKTVFFDDSPRNIAAGKAAGFHTVIVGSSAVVAGADVALESIHNIKEALPELWEAGEHVQAVDLRSAAVETTVLALNWAHRKLHFGPACCVGNKAETTSRPRSFLHPLLPPEASAAASHSSLLSAAVAAMGRGRSRKPRNFAAFRLCPRPGAADASDRVFVRVDNNPYSVPGFTDDAGPSSAAAAGGDDDAPSSSKTGPLPENVRREILELGLPDDGYDYLPHLREPRPSLSSTGGGASAAFLPSRRHARAHFGPPLDVKAYDASRVRIGSGEATATTAAVEVRRVENAIDPDVARLLEDGDEPARAGSESDHDDLEEDFVLVANQPEEDFVLVANQPEEEEDNITAVDDAE
ncbi:hypothetical protein E2562_013295 [Oryza meyeriana var. granulata]|uniref:Uncharacterized protein n=1 Tax=Oryza meyeriana var. granulata TaxID=110450 RepID=A0A6G1D3E1_9ORYZ|nr:hypothetical protein E2562_013295 [Oryza meyeriana var. granulata]KAF0906910.1 hypothetical protein E2562_013295 [Oryza meyeriana var. granulata]KAF0906911.1 hypothetical protein E2562_013295 [Oryza meyeriana var. granulata]